MKRTITILSLLVVAALLVGSIQGCKGSTGPAGPGGDTVTVVGNLEGFKEGINCGDCHNPDTDTTYNVWAKKYQWEESKHFFGGDFERNSSTCANCHTTEGFIQAAFGRPVTNHIDASPPGCFACHSPHARGDFSLRLADPVVVNSAVAGVADATFDYGKGNLCVNCHKTRTLSPEPDPTKTALTDTITISSNRWYPHYGVQSQMLMGTGGFQFADFAEGYTNSHHTINNDIKAEGCIACHMADATAGSGLAGGHTMNISFENTSHQIASLTTGCTVAGCHTASGFTIDYNGTRTEVEEYLDSLKHLLLDTAVVNKWNVGAMKAWIAEGADGSITINAGSGNNALKIRPASRSGALFNFFFVEHDKSEGAHNTKYTVGLLKSSIAELQKP
jgi:hypothetical protein